MLEIADVVVDVRARDLQPAYSYRVPDALKNLATQGVLVVVGFHGRTALGYVVARRRVTADRLGFTTSKLKQIMGVARGARIPADLLSLIRFAAAEYSGPMWLALHSAVPQSSRAHVRPLLELVSEESSAEPMEEAVIRYLSDRAGEARESELRSMFGDALERAVDRLRRKGIVRKTWEMVEPPVPRQSPPLYRIASEHDISAFIESADRKKAQAAAATALLELAGTAVPPAKLGLRTDIRDKLVAAGLLRSESVRDALLGSAPSEEQLTAAQRGAAAQICAALATGRTERFLLHGVTASGKTEVYLRAISECLSVGRTALVMVPEIALAGQILSRVQERFGEAVSVIHSGMGHSQRFNQWQRIARGDTPIVVGPRSAIFAPVPALGLIVIDEEHEASYKQGNLLRYDARTVAERRAMEAGAVLVAGSATPSVESYHGSTKGKTTLIEMPERVSRQGPPPLELLDLRELRPSLNSLSQPLQEALKETIGRREQAILFLNRRAFAPFLLCRDCGEVPECSRCSVSLAFHRRDVLLKCHHCGLTRKPPDTCPKCAGTRILPFGLGTQRIEEDVWTLFPDAKVGRLDRDTKDADRVLDAFRKGDIDVLVGTQMVAKGLDFPRVSLVGVVSADTGLHMPDFRAAERTFQILVQVAGRAGRAEIPGRVLVQTFNVEHPAIRCAMSYDYQSFYEREIRIRQEAGYPPFRRLAHLIVSHEDRAVALADARQIAAVLTALKFRGLEMLGPAPTVPERVQGYYRWSLLLKLPPSGHPGPLIEEALRAGGKRKAFVTVDVDPQSLS